MENWLASADSLRNADVIFVLAGRQIRKAYGLELFQEHRAPRILLSTGRFEIRRFSRLPLPLPLDLLAIASGVAPPLRHYFVSFDTEHVEVERIPVRRFGTLGEIQTLREWLCDRPEIKSVLVVSSGVHLRRVRMCCRALLPTGLAVHVVRVPEQEVSPDEGDEEGVLRELVKLLVYGMVLALGAFSVREVK